MTVYVLRRCQVVFGYDQLVYSTIVKWIECSRGSGASVELHVVYGV